MDLFDKTAMREKGIYLDFNATTPIRGISFPSVVLIVSGRKMGSNPSL